jgi:hypothetical protein
MSRPGRTFHFPRGSRVLAETGPKTSMISMGHFCPDTGPVCLCPALAGGRRRMTETTHRPRWRR